MEAEGGELSHVKVRFLHSPMASLSLSTDNTQVHGALYFIIRDHPNLLRAFLRAHISLSPNDPLPFFGLAGTAHESVCQEMGVPFVPELFVDIDYNSEGKLLSVPESKPATEQLVRDKMAHILNHQESKLIWLSCCQWSTVNMLISQLLISMGSHSNSHCCRVVEHSRSACTQTCPRRWTMLQRECRET